MKITIEVEAKEIAGLLLALETRPEVSRDPDIEIGAGRKYLISLREKRGLTQQQAASQLLISQNYLSLIETGNRQTDLKLSTLKSFAKLYKVPLAKLIEEEAKCVNSSKDKDQSVSGSGQVLPDAGAGVPVPE